MAYEGLIAQIRQRIYENEEQAITGTVMQGILLSLLSELGEGYRIAGIIEPTDDPSPSAEVREVFIAFTPGEYEFGQFTLEAGDFAFIFNDAGTFHAKRWRLKDYFYNKNETDAALATKQDTLVSGTNIKTINGQSVLGSGDLEVAQSLTFDLDVQEDRALIIPFPSSDTASYRIDIIGHYSGGSDENYVGTLLVGMTSPTEDVEAYYTGSDFSDLVSYMGIVSTDGEENYYLMIVPNTVLDSCRMVVTPFETTGNEIEVQGEYNYSRESEITPVTYATKSELAAKYSKPSTGIPASDLASAVQTSLGKADTTATLIPAQATAQNQLADKDFVNSSIATNTATFKGTYNLVTDLSLTTSATQAQIAAALGTAVSGEDNNDYAFVQIPTADATPTEIARVDRYKFDGTDWAFEWSLNNSSFTAAQWAALNSDITANKVAKLDALPTRAELTLEEAALDNVFIVEFRVTSFADIISAHNAGKQCFCNYGEFICRLSQILTSGGVPIYAYFVSMGSGRTSVTLIVSNDNTWASQQYNLERVLDKVTSLSSSSTDTEYPSAKCVYDAIPKTMTGATASTAGTSGTVPAPAAGDNEKFLRGDGTWQTAGGGGSTGKTGVIRQTQTWTQAADGGYDYVMSNQVTGTIPQANIDLFVSAGATFNENGYAPGVGYFELNGLTDISYEEMMKIYNYGQLPYHADFWLYTLNVIRTNLPSKKVAVATGWMARDATIEVFAFNPDSVCFLSDGTYPFYGAEYTKAVRGIIDVSAYGDGGRPFEGTNSLVSIQLKSIKGSFSFAASSRLSLASVVYMVENAANTGAITITLHATAYARCQADTTEYTYQGNTYTGIIALATARNITIASA